MNKQIERRRTAERLHRAAHGSFSTVYRALSAAAEENAGATGLSTETVMGHIRRLVAARRQAG